uniref:Uncharacterized protein n=1 Tax=Arundo donax TaxID=35708 RepID=A0A0A9HIX0_ARUDO
MQLISEVLSKSSHQLQFILLTSQSYESILLRSQKYKLASLVAHCPVS